MNTGVPPTPLKARTGDETPPGMTAWARAKADAELDRLGMGEELSPIYLCASTPLVGLEGIRLSVPSAGRCPAAMGGFSRISNAQKKTAVWGRASRTAVGGESENREADASCCFLAYLIG